MSVEQVRAAMAKPENVELPDSMAAAQLDLAQDALALEMGRRGWNRDAKYVAAWGKWLFWDGVCWRIDETRTDMTRTRDFLRTRADEVTTWANHKAEELAGLERKKLEEWGKRQAESLRHKSTVASIEFLAQSNVESAARAVQFDADLMLLGTPGGTVDLRSGDLRPAERGDMITKQTAIAPAPRGTKPKRWLSFLREIFADDFVLIDFMQRAAGYALTGCTNEHKMLFLHGTGRNGKSVFLNTLQWLLNDYARKAAAETFLHSSVERHSTDVAGLNGARLVVGSELPRGKSWDESIIKDLTGGDRMTARYMRQDFFDFDPQLTLMIAGNTQPSFRGVDEAIRSRVVMVPFTVTIPPERRDTEMGEHLKAEGPAILRWCLDGTEMWLRRGLDVPEKVKAASAEYFDNEDTVGQFLEAEVDQVTGHFERSTMIYQRFTQWLDGQGLAAWTQNTLMKELRGRGFSDAKSNGQRGLRGLRLR
jgi:putative DNA primase/helicase